MIIDVSLFDLLHEKKSPEKLQKNDAEGALVHQEVERKASDLWRRYQQ